MFKATIFSTDTDSVIWQQIFRTEGEAWASVECETCDGQTITVCKVWEKPKGRV